MLSICIPIFNFDVRSLVYDLHQQALQASEEFEILLMDDCSLNLYKKQNQECASLENVTLLELEQNIGRSRIRNKLAEVAIYRYIVFLDCDVIVAHKKFIINYLENIDGKDKVICGGHIYKAYPPDNEKLLHWYYGNIREVKNARDRNKDPYMSFMTGNFMISKDIFRLFKFHEKISRYGHEDTLFGLDLLKNSIPTIHINNPVVHIGLDTNLAFIKKTKQSIDNLIYLEPILVKYNHASSKIRLLSTFRKVKRLGICYPLAWIFKMAENAIEQNLTSKRPNMILLDLYKLGYLCMKSIRRKDS